MTKIEQNNKAIVFVLDESYADAGRLAIRDVWVHSGSKYPIYVLHTDTLSSTSKSKILNDLERAGAAEDVVRFKDVTSHGKLFAGLKKRNHIGLIAYAKLLMGTLLWEKEQVHTAYYFDVDILVMRGLSELFEKTPKKAIAVVDHNSPDDFRMLHGTDGTYINTGVIVANLLRWSSINAMEKFEKVIKTMPEKLRYNDQDVFSAALIDEIEFLPIEYNFMLSPRFNSYVKKHDATGLDWDPNEVDPAIVHFIGPQKPWKDSGVFHTFKMWRKRRIVL